MSKVKSLAGQQSEEYRKGQVLGFTMAEIMLVLLFLLLLLLGAKLHKLTKSLEDSYKPTAPESQSINTLKNTLESLQTNHLISEKKDVLWLTQQLTLKAEDVVKQQMEMTENAQEKIEQLLKEKQELLYKNQILQRMQKDGQNVVKELVDAKKKIQDLKQLESIFKANNLTHKEAEQCLLSCGGGPKSCWGESLANPDFIYNIALYDDGFYVSPEQKSINKNMSDWNSLSSLAKVSEPTFLNKGVFRKKFTALLAHAQANECVFQVRLIDQQTSNKQIYKSQRRLVEGYVYPTPFKMWSYGSIGVGN